MGVRHVSTSRRSSTACDTWCTTTSPGLAVDLVADDGVNDVLILTAWDQVDLLPRGEIFGDTGFQPSTVSAQPMCVTTHRHHAHCTSDKANTLAQPIVV